MSIDPNELERKIDEAIAKDEKLKTPPSVRDRNSSSAMRAGTEMVSAIIVGVVFGYWIDRWLGTAPGFMIGMMFLGFAAGFANIYRAQTKRADTNKNEG